MGLCLGGSQLLFAGGWQISLHGHRQIGMAHTGTGLAFDASSLYFNPGALSFIKRGGIQFGGSVMAPATSYLGPFAGDTVISMEDFIITPLYLYTAFRPAPGKKLQKWGFGLGLNNPFGGQTKWGDDWKGKFISQEFIFNTLFLHPTLSYQLTEKLGLGGGVSLGFANILRRKALDATDGINNTLGSVQYTGTARGMGFNLGVYLKANDHMSLGITYRSGINLNVNQGQAVFNVPASLEQDFPSQNFTTQLRMPRSINIGLGYQTEDRFLLAVDLNFVGWQVIDSVRFQLEEPIEDLPDYAARNYQNTYSLRIGGEYYANDRLTIRGGFFYDVSPVPQDFVTPEFPNSNHIGISAGIGLRVGNRFSLDLSYVYEFSGERTSIYEEAQFFGTYETTISNFGLGIGFQF